MLSNIVFFNIYFFVPTLLDQHSAGLLKWGRGGGVSRSQRPLGFSACCHGKQGKVPISWRTWLFVGREKKAVALRSSSRAVPTSYFGAGGCQCPSLPSERGCQCQSRPLGNTIKADEKRAVDIFMSPEYSAGRFYGDHRKPERQ